MPDQPQADQRQEAGGVSAVAGPFEAARAKPRRFAVWPALTALGLLAAIGLTGGYGFGAFLVLAPLFACVALTATIASIVLAVINVRRCRARAAIYLVLPSIVLAATIAPAAILGPFVWLGRFVRFEANRSHYEAEIVRSQHPIGKRFVTFDWDGFGGNNTFLLFDETDALARGQVPEKGQMMGECASRSTHFVGHYYFCDY